jgi:hypothetical protein
MEHATVTLYALDILDDLFYAARRMETLQRTMLVYHIEC